MNNAGYFAPKSFTEITDDDWQYMLDVNVMSGVRLSRYYAPAGGQLGRIVFLSSESALQIPAEMIHYGVSKTALLGVSRGLAELTAGTGVTVNAVLPGPTRSEGVASFFAELAQAQGVQAQMERDFIAQNRPSSLLRWPRWRKWPTWWCTPARPRPRPPTARRCAWTAAWSARSPEPAHPSSGILT